MYRQRRETLLLERPADTDYEQGNVLTGNTEDCAEVNIPPEWSGVVWWSSWVPLWGLASQGWCTRPLGYLHSLFSKDQLPLSTVYLLFLIIQSVFSLLLLAASSSSSWNCEQLRPQQHLRARQAQQLPHPRTLRAVCPPHAFPHHWATGYFQILPMQICFLLRNFVFS